MSYLYLRGCFWCQHRGKQKNKRHRRVVLYTSIHVNYLLFTNHRVLSNLSPRKVGKTCSAGGGSRGVHTRRMYKRSSFFCPYSCKEETRDGKDFICWDSSCLLVSKLHVHRSKYPKCCRRNIRVTELVTRVNPCREYRLPLRGGKFGETLGLLSEKTTVVYDLMCGTERDSTRWRKSHIVKNLFWVKNMFRDLTMSFGVSDDLGPTQPYSPPSGRDVSTHVDRDKDRDSTTYTETLR